MVKPLICSTGSAGLHEAGCCAGAEPGTAHHHALLSTRVPETTLSAAPASSKKLSFLWDPPTQYSLAVLFCIL